jgi:hypothetical protein
MPFDFVCLTENPEGLISKIKVKSLPRIAVQGWWMKPWMFSAELGFTGDVLFLDLDLVLCSNIDKLWTYNPEDDFVIIRDFTRHQNPTWQKFNSSVIRFRAEKYHWIWDDFLNNHRSIMPKNHGDQDYLYSLLKDKGKYWPDSWIQSYKWEMRDKRDIVPINGKRNFVSIKDPRVEPDLCIAVFHGDPNPEEVKDPWVITNWQ